MQKLKELYQHSLKEFCNTKTVVLCGILAALAIVLSMVASIQFGPYIRIGFSGLPNRIVEFLFGPVVGCLFGGADRQYHPVIYTDLCWKNCSKIWFFHNENKVRRMCLIA